MGFDFKDLVHSAVYETERGNSIGLVSFAATNKEDTSEVQLFHISVLNPVEIMARTL